MAEYKSVAEVFSNENSIFTYTVWKPNSDDLFHIKIFDGERSWSGKFTYELAKQFRESLDETEEEYSNTVQDSLMKHGDFTYSFVSHSNRKTAMLSWKVMAVDSQYKLTNLVHGTVPVYVEEPSKESLVDFLVEVNHDLRNYIDNLINEIEKLKNDFNTYKCRFKKFGSIKTSLDLNMHCKFSELLAAKKRKMESLESNNELEKLPCILAIENMLDKVEAAD